jgi:hypothetical protein
VRPEGLDKLIKIIHLIGYPTRGLQVCNIAPYFIDVRISIHGNSTNVSLSR